MKFRKRSLTVEANQWLGTFSTVPGVYVEGDLTEVSSYYVVTMHGHRTPIAPGDWIIVELRQTMKDVIAAYPCAPSMFEVSYEAAE